MAPKAKARGRAEQPQGRGPRGQERPALRPVRRLTKKTRCFWVVVRGEMELCQRAAQREAQSEKFQREKLLEEAEVRQLEEQIAAAEGDDQEGHGRRRGARHTPRPGR
ncbi:unnamed protein product [Prorocentrum cordatum]|uniref:Uncharacterized protein n=1 Tax=Prorocentrum cordatum TaxID=2364126 RepID=A0ABN9QIG3_9DINO|nr:unnamed protein product [Polarella glacialis]